MTKYNDRNYRVDDVDFKVNPMSEFDTKDGGKMKYVDYYQNVSNILWFVSVSATVDGA